MSGIPKNLHQGKRFSVSPDSQPEINLEERKKQEHFSLFQLTLLKPCPINQYLLILSSMGGIRWHLEFQRTVQGETLPKIALLKRKAALWDPAQSVTTLTHSSTDCPRTMHIFAEASQKYLSCLSSHFYPDHLCKASCKEVGGNKANYKWLITTE